MPEKKLLDQLADTLRMKHYSRKTISAYVQWCRQYILFHKVRHPREMGANEIKAFLIYLANNRHVAASTQNQAHFAIRFMYREVLKIEIGEIDDLLAKTTKRLWIRIVSPHLAQRKEFRQCLITIAKNKQIISVILQNKTRISFIQPPKVWRSN